MILAFIIIIAGALAYTVMLYHIKSSWTLSNTSIIGKEKLHTFPKTSVVIAARNEQLNIITCLESIISNKYFDHNGTSGYEIIVIDDHSSDDTFTVVANFVSDEKALGLVSMYKLPDGLTGKKAALTFAISKAINPIILCTDADCIVPHNWINEHVEALVKSKVAAQTGLVYLNDDKTTLTRFQMMDYLATMAITNYGYHESQFYLANGANLCYYKSGFELVNGYIGNETIASGDDVFLINKIAKTKTVGCYKNLNSIVLTQAEATWTDLWRQRKRWATKATSSNNLVLNAIQGFIFMYSLAIVLYIVLGLSIFPPLLVGGLIALMIKMGVDYLFLSSLAQDFKSKQITESFLVCFFIYFVHILSAGWFALEKGNYQWKERVTK